MSLCPVTWGQCSTPTCIFSNVQFLHCKIAQDKNILASRILKSHLIFFKSQLQPGCIRVNLDDAGEEQSRNYFWFYCNCPWNTIIVFVLVSWCDRRAALSETIKALQVQVYNDAIPLAQHEEYIAQIKSRKVVFQILPLMRKLPSYVDDFGDDHVPTLYPVSPPR